MSCNNVLEHLLKTGELTSVLVKSNQKKEEVTEFQQILHQLGFDAELNWSKYGADGYYGGSCVAAVKAFGERNGIDTDGKVVTEALGRAFITRYDSLDELQLLHKLIAQNTVSTKLNSNSRDKISIAALQTLLNDLGYGAELNWSKYKNDGFYGRSTIAAVTAFYSKEALQGDAKEFTSEAANLVVSRLASHYGDDWSKNLKSVDAPVVADEPETTNAGTVDAAGALVTYVGSEFQGKKVLADKLFVPHLNQINALAKTHGVKIHVTSSWRANANVAGAIVTPAKKSNHMAGHAIDMNLVFPGGWANSSYLKRSNEANWHSAVAGFINAIRADATLRWGGDFRTQDPVHIDDGLNIHNPTLWEERYQATQLAAQQMG